MTQMNYMTYDEITIIKLPVNPFYRTMPIHLYSIDGLLVDSGPGIWRPVLTAAFQSMNIEQVALTHHHADHAGMASWLAKKVSVPVFYHESNRNHIKQKTQHPWYWSLLPSTRRLLHTRAFPNVIQTPTHQIHPIETPGHTPDHICLLEPEKGWLFTGDLYITPHPKVFAKEESITAYIDSLKKLRAIDYDTIFCAHEGVIQNGKEKLEQKRIYLERTRWEVIRLHRLGYSDRAIIKKFFPGKVRLEKATFHSFSRLNLIRSCYRE